MIKDYMPYIVTAFSSILSASVAIYVCNKNNKVAIANLKEEQSRDLENKLKLMEEEYNKKFELLNQEYALKIGGDMMANLLDKTTGAIYDSPAFKGEVNKQTSAAFRNQKIKKKHK